jgi:hypothetical protein
MKRKPSINHWAIFFDWFSLSDACEKDIEEVRLIVFSRFSWRSYTYILCSSRQEKDHTVPRTNSYRHFSFSAVQRLQGATAANNQEGRRKPCQTTKEPTCLLSPSMVSSFLTKSGLGCGFVKKESIPTNSYGSSSEVRGW